MLKKDLTHPRAVRKLVNQQVRDVYKFESKPVTFEISWEEQKDIANNRMPAVYLLVSQDVMNAHPNFQTGWHCETRPKQGALW